MLYSRDYYKTEAERLNPSPLNVEEKNAMANLIDQAYDLAQKVPLVDLSKSFAKAKTYEELKTLHNQILETLFEVSKQDKFGFYNPLTHIKDQIIELEFSVHDSMISSIYRITAYPKPKRKLFGK